MRQHELDEIDVLLLNLLQKNGRMPIKELAAAVHLSSPATATRIRRMEEDGYILGYQAQINPIAIGLYTKAFIALEVTPEQKKDFYPYIQSCRNVIECNCVTGDYSMMLEVLFCNSVELDHFINEIQQFGRTKTLIVFSTSVEHRGIQLDWNNW